MEKQKLVIHVEGGLIQAVYSNVNNIEVEIYDLDNDETKDRLIEELDKAKEGLKEIA